MKREEELKRLDAALWEDAPSREERHIPVYNTDRVDEDLDDFSQQVFEAPKSRHGGWWLLLLLLLGVAALWILREMGVIAYG